VNNFFVTFIEVLKDRAGTSMEVEPGVTSGDFLNGFHQGTRQALFEKDRESITITVPDVSPQTVGKLIALYDRAVGLYGTLVNVNAYHQPGVEAGKKAAAGVLAIQGKIVGALKANKGKQYTAEQLADEIGAKEDVETVFKILQHLAANRRVKQQRAAGAPIFAATYSA
jgi:glucose-6-phosphate isomerase